MVFIKVCGLETLFHGVCSSSLLYYRLLYDRISPVPSDLRAEKESLFCPRSPKLPAALESMSTTQLPDFFTLCSLGSCFSKTIKTLLISCSPSTLFLPHPLRWVPSAPWCCTSLGETMEGVGASTSLWAVAADLLQYYFQPLLQIQNLLIQVGRLKYITALGIL